MSYSSLYQSTSLCHPCYSILPINQQPIQILCRRRNAVLLQGRFIALWNIDRIVFVHQFLLFLLVDCFDLQSKKVKVTIIFSG